MAIYKEIVTKAVIGKGKKTSTTNCQLTPEVTPDTVLGCWVINHEFRGNNNLGNISVVGSFDVNVWYSYDNNTKTSVASQHYTYSDNMKMNIRNDSKLTNNSEIIVRSLNQPSVTDVRIDSGVIKMNVEKELGIEVVGDTKVKVSVEEDEDEYELIEDEVNDNDLDQIDSQVDTEYLK